MNMELNIIMQNFHLFLLIGLICKNFYLETYCAKVLEVTIVLSCHLNLFYDLKIYFLPSESDVSSLICYNPISKSPTLTAALVILMIIQCQYKSNPPNTSEVYCWLGSNYAV